MNYINKDTTRHKKRHKNKTILQVTYKRKDIKEERENTKSNQNPLKHNGQKKKDTTLYRKLKTEQHKPH